MSLSKREFLQVLGAASVAGMALSRHATADAASAEEALYDLPPLGRGAGFVSFLHMTDCHAQLKPILFREPSVNLGIGSMQGQIPHLVGEHLLKLAQVPAGSALAHAYTYLDFERSAQRFGKVGGFAHLATLVKRLKASRPGALLLDGGDTWQGSATSLWTNAQDMVDACKALTVDVMTGHWEFTYGMKRVKEIVDKDFKGSVDFVAQNVKTADFGDPVFAPYVMKEMNGVKVAIVGQAFPYTPIANPRYMVADWEFGIRDEDMQKTVDEARGKGAQVVVVISHNGMDVDLKMASRVRGIDAIFGGHTHDGVPVAVPVKNPGGTTLVTNAGSNGKFLGVVDFEVKAGKFKGPVGLGLLQSIAAGDFSERSMASGLVPLRNIGVQVGTTWLDGALEAAAGVFNSAGDGRNPGNFDFTDGKELAGRVFVHPFKPLELKWLKGLGFGVGGSHAQVSSNALGLPAAIGEPLPGYYTSPGTQQFFAYNPLVGPVVADGKHWRLSPQGYWYAGPFGLMGEHVWSSQDVYNSTTFRADNLTHRAWHVTGGWFLTGEDASFGPVDPRRPFALRSPGWGAWQVVGRYSRLDIDDDAFPSFSNPDFSATDATAWSVGLNWWLNRNLRVLASFTHTTFTGGGASPSIANPGSLVAPTTVTAQDENLFSARVQLSF